MEKCASTEESPKSGNCDTRGECNEAESPADAVKLYGCEQNLSKRKDDSAAASDIVTSQEENITV